MCGIAGFWLGANTAISNLNDIARRMCNELSHRGPNHQGVWSNNNERVALGHQRLTVLDLTPTGSQPMASFDSRYRITFNGEIYNHEHLRAEIQNEGVQFSWRGSSDTETLLAALVVWGIDKTLSKLNGMFAFALWDQELKILTLARDRIGEKPLYYGWQGDTLIFGSELKALKAHPVFRAEIDRNALALFLKYSYVPCPSSIYKSIFKLPPGTYLSILCNKRQQDPKAYWSAKKCAQEGQNKLYKGTADDAAKELQALLGNTILGQSRADVGVGAFLSGGIDSTTVVSIMQAQASLAVKTFTIGFEDEEYNEATNASDIARYLGTEHTEMCITSKDALGVIPLLPELYDEPFADSSQIPTYLLAKLARKHVTVALSGDGGDELFGGYSRYYWGIRIWETIRNLPLPLRSALLMFSRSVPPKSWNAFYNHLKLFLPKAWQLNNIGDKLIKVSKILGADSQESVYMTLVTAWKHPERVVIIDDEGLNLNLTKELTVDFDDRSHWMMYQDLATYLPDDIMVKVDRATMGVSLEARAPFLDHRVVEFAWTLPLAMKINKGVGKWILRKMLHEKIPRGMLERPKMGFGVPLDVWLRGPLRDWAEDLISISRLKKEGFLHVKPIRRKWKEHLSGRQNWSSELWNVLMFQSWLDQNCRKL